MPIQRAMSSPERPRTGLRALTAAVNLRGLAAISGRNHAGRPLKAWRAETYPAALPRSSAHGRPEHGAGRRARTRGHAGQRPLYPGDVRPVQHRERGGPPTGHGARERATTPSFAETLRRLTDERAESRK